MTKPYTWDEIEYFLRKELSKTKHVMTFGTIGSRNIDHDIDLIITKNHNLLFLNFIKKYIIYLMQ